MGGAGHDASMLLVVNRRGRDDWLRERAIGAGFTNLETVTGIDALGERIRRGERRDRPNEVLMSLVPATQELFQGECLRHLLGLHDAAGVALALIATDGPVTPDPTLTGRISVGDVDLIAADTDPIEFRYRLKMLAATHAERRRGQLRERDLHAELSDLKSLETRLHRMAYQDELTGLGNRRHLNEAMGIAVLRAEKLGRPCAVTLIDVDRFKLVNDLEGYETGDHMLRAIGEVLKGFQAPGETLARIGSDEFCLLSERIGAEEVLARAEKIRARLENNHFEKGTRFYRTCVSIGVAALQPGESCQSAGELLARADQACFLAKQHGRNRVHAFSRGDPELAVFRRDHGLAPVIRDALEHDRLFFHFQPIVRLLDGAVTHYECLIRMRRVDGELVMPGDFIPAAERTGLIHRIDLWAVDQALEFLDRLPSEHDRVSVSVNLSGHAFDNPELVDLIARRLDMCWVSPTRLVFEITETAAIENVARCRDTVARLRALGCRFSLDDFGSGFSTFHYIKHFPVDYLKIDGSFIVNIARDHTDRELVRHMVSIARSLGKETIAEYVESREALATVARLGVDYVQGNHLAAAAPQAPVEVDLDRLLDTPPREKPADGLLRAYPGLASLGK